MGSQLELFGSNERKTSVASDIFEEIQDYISATETLDEKVNVINKIKILLHSLSPFKEEPVDCVVWVKSDDVAANDYNPNSVAPPEMELLRTSIGHDGYTQPVVTWNADNNIEVVDGFHRTRVCKEFADVRERVHGYLPVVTIKKENEGRSDRIASTIRHNRARGKHNVDSMSDIVIELKRRNWSQKKIAKNLGMDEDEILRLCQMSGLQEMFADDEFSNSWDIDIMSESDIELILDECNIEPDKAKKEERILHTYDKWECHKAGFYENKAPGDMTNEDCENAYYELLSDTNLFSKVLSEVIVKWEKSCEHYLTNESMNRVAWLGQAALCLSQGIPACFRGGYNLLTDLQKEEADRVAFKYLNIWLVKNGREEANESEITNKKKADIY